MNQEANGMARSELSTRINKLISTEALNKRIQSGELLQVVNVLPPDRYHLGSIKHSVKIPLESLDARSGELEKSRTVITYSAGPECGASKQAAELLDQKKFHTLAYAGGLSEWKAAMLPME